VSLDPGRNPDPWGSVSHLAHKGGLEQSVPVPVDDCNKKNHDKNGSVKSLNIESTVLTSHRQIAAWLFRMLANDRGWLGLLAPGESVTSAHAEIIADRLNASAAIGSHHPLTAICALAGDLCNYLAVF
jgi:hypothetical protein